MGAEGKMVMGISGLVATLFVFDSLRPTTRGTIFDRFGQPTEGVSVSMEGITQVTGADGAFELQAFFGTHTITFSKAGYYTVSRAINLGIGGGVVMSVPLIPKVIDDTGILAVVPVYEGSGSSLVDVFGHDGVIDPSSSWQELSTGARVIALGSPTGNVGLSNISLAAPSTIVFWVNMAQSAQQVGEHIYLLDYLLYQHSSNNLMYIQGSNDLFNVTPSVANWHQIALTVEEDGLSNSAILSVDKTETHITQQTGSHVIPGFNGMFGSLTARGLRSYPGLLGGVIRLYNRALTKAEKDQLYDADAPALVAA